MYFNNASVHLEWVDPPVNEILINFAKKKKIKEVFKKGTTIFEEGDVVHYAHLVTKGWAAYCLNSVCGESRIACLAGPGRIFGLAPAFNQLPLNISVKALEDCETYKVSRDDLIQGMLEDINLGIEIVSNVTMRLRCAFEGANIFSSLSTPKDKLIYYFVSMIQCGEYQEHGDWYELTVNFPHGRIAEIIGTTRVTVCRLFKYYKNVGKLKNANNKIYVHKGLIMEDYEKIGISS
ncbi:Crp/Fnr family transcriptional regulator [Dehalobacter sp. 14DCB1]|uniref:Crp/Fnr family transcriptional regulator n=1 Tax=Dehalobacter sp. 14DCB1 TaxID=2070227 RepID=UPI00104CC2E9|nr:Crp/Fnr family transcriptional regulator [Dehalobacter sp. 14DCB1]TCX51686.1 Crp/Fnr family transcriptional regulator [Dehalobacter sp. 14DCB1]